MTQPHPEHLPEPPSGEQTRIIRRAPTGPVPVVPREEPVTTAIPHPPRANAVAEPPATAVAACVIAMLSGWTTSVVATDLITGWWHTDRLFCVAVGFLALVFAASTITGVVLVLLRRPAGRYLIVAGALVALLAFGGVFIAGAKIPWAVYAMPLLPVTSAVLTLLPSTRRWAAT